MATSMEDASVLLREMLGDSVDLELEHYILRMSPAERERRSHVEEQPKSAEWLAARDRFEKRYEKLIQQGEQEGFLVDDFGEGWSVTRTVADRVTVFDETEEAWRERVSKLPAPGEIRITTSPLVRPGQIIVLQGGDDASYR